MGAGVHLHPVVALVMSVCVHTKLTLEAKQNQVVGRGLEHNMQVIFFSLAISFVTGNCNLLHISVLFFGRLVTFRCVIQVTKNRTAEK